MIQKGQACIGIPTYKPDLEKLKVTIQSVLNQDYKNIHIIISENSPKNDLVSKYVQSLKRMNISIEYHGQKKFLPQVENWDFCIMSSRSEYIMILGDDDELSKDYISSSVKILNNDQNYYGVACVIKHIFRDGRTCIDPGYFYENENKLLRAKKFLFDETDTYINALMRTNIVQKFGFKNSISYYWWPNKTVIQQLFTQFLFTCILYGKGTYNDKAIYFHQDPRPRGFKADFGEEDDKLAQNVSEMKLGNFFVTSLKGYLRHLNLWFNYLKISMRHDFKNFPTYLYYILTSFAYLEYKYTRKILRKLKNHFLKKESLY